MSLSLQQLIRRVQRFGTHPEMDELALRHASLLNLFYTISLPTFIGSTFQTYISDGPLLGNAMLALTLIYCSVVVFLAKGKFIAAEYTLSLVSIISICFFQNLAGVEAGIYFFFFPLLIMLSFMSDFRRINYFTIHILFTLVGLLFCIVFERKLFWFKQDPIALRESFYYNLIASVVLTSFCTFIIIWLNYKQYITFQQREQERRENELRMQTSLREKEMLVAEIHHRVKNNLAVISSLLNLQLNNVTNEYTRQVLLDSRNRVSSMALIHQKLYRNNNAEDVDFDTYIHELVNEIRISYPSSTPMNIQVNITASHVPLNLTTAIPCGLILNELLSNCYKHAFPNGRSGAIDVQFSTKSDMPDTFTLAVADNGKGLPHDFDPAQLNSLGITIIESLAEQLDGNLKWDSVPEKGTAFQLVFRQTAGR